MKERKKVVKRRKRRFALVALHCIGNTVNKRKSKDPSLARPALLLFRVQEERTRMNRESQIKGVETRRWNKKNKIKEFKVRRVEF